MRIDTIKTIYFIVYFYICDLIVLGLGSYIAQLIYINPLIIYILMYLIASFIGIYFSYPYFLRKRIFSNVVYLRDVGYLFLFFLITFLVINYNGGIL